MPFDRGGGRARRSRPPPGEGLRAGEAASSARSAAARSWGSSRPASARGSQTCPGTTGRRSVRGRRSRRTRRARACSSCSPSSAGLRRATSSRSSPAATPTRSACSCGGSRWSAASSAAAPAACAAARQSAPRLARRSSAATGSLISAVERAWMRIRRGHASSRELSRRQTDPASMGRRTTAVESYVSAARPPKSAAFPQCTAAVAPDARGTGRSHAVGHVLRDRCPAMSIAAQATGTATWLCCVAASHRVATTSSYASAPPGGVPHR